MPHAQLPARPLLYRPPRCSALPPSLLPFQQVHEWEPLLLAARSLGVVVEGVAFHVGSGATHPAAFSHAIELARRAWDLGTATGFEMKVLDIGGGFQGGRVDKRGHADFGGVAEAVNSALAAHFPETEGEDEVGEVGGLLAALCLQHCVQQRGCYACVQATGRSLQEPCCACPAVAQPGLAAAPSKR